MTLVYIRCNKYHPHLCDEREKLIQKSDNIIIRKALITKKEILNKEIKELKKIIKENNIDLLRIYYLDESSRKRLEEELEIDVIVDDEVKVKAPSKKLEFFIKMLKELKTRDIYGKDDEIFRDVSNQTALNYINEIVEAFEPLVYLETTKKGKVLKLRKEENIIREIFDKLENIENIHNILSSTLSENELKKLSDETKKFIRKDQDLILFKTRPFEKLNEDDNTIFNELKKAISEKRYVDIYDYSKSIEEVKGYKTKDYEDVIPLKIIFMENNWYFAGVVKKDNQNIVRFFRISFIGKIELKNKYPKNSIKKEYLEFLESFETPFTLYGVEWKKAILKVSPRIAVYFEKKKHFPKQKIYKNKDEFFIEVGYTQYMELAYLVKKWLPDIEIVECDDNSKERLKKELQEYLQKF